MKSKLHLYPQSRINEAEKPQPQETETKEVLNQATPDAQPQLGDTHKLLSSTHKGASFPVEINKLSKKMDWEHEQVENGSSSAREELGAKLARKGRLENPRPLTGIEVSQSRACKSPSFEIELGRTESRECRVRDRSEAR